MAFHASLKVFPNLQQTKIHYWSSDWGTEWTPHSQSASEPLEIAVVSGRSSKGHHPFLIIEDGEHAFILAIMWSGNWQINTQCTSNSLEVKADSNNPNLEVLTHLSENGGINEASERFIESFRALDIQHSHPKLAMEWNSWWPYEDVDVDAHVILDNAKVAKEIGLEVAVLDAGWFGSTDLTSYWYDYRGDWQDINLARFPKGLKSLGEDVRALGIDFGIWVEIEALGLKSRVAIENPDFMATRDGESLGYLCFGNPLGYLWARRQIQELVNATGATWIKIDFNIDPKFGCNRSDHGHSLNNGLTSHIERLYLLLDELKANNSELIVESCSSGGLRWDLGIAQHVDLGFSSDPDWPEHALSTFWASSQFFPVEKLLGWCNSEWRGDHPRQTFKISKQKDPRDLEFLLSISLLGAFGLSQKLSEFSSDMRMVAATYIRLYKSHFRPRFQDNAYIKRLTPQPLRDNAGCRTVAFAIISEHYAPIVLIYQLPGEHSLDSITFTPSDSQVYYRISNLLTGFEIHSSHRGSVEFDTDLADNTAKIVVFEKV